MVGIKAVLFDWGGVLIEDPSPGISDFVRKELSLDVDARFQFPDAALEAFQKGIITEQEFWDETGVMLNQKIDSGELSLWRRAFESVYQEKPDVFKWIRALRDRAIKTSVLSNTEIPSVEMLRSMKYDCFDEIIFSCECRMVKPDPEIYKYALDQMSLSAEEVLFIDDKEINVNAARKVGLVAHCLRDLDSLFALASELGLPN
jgi:epoxide hydrolase-like predicted phosphatase